MRRFSRNVALGLRDWGRVGFWNLTVASETVEARLRRPDVRERFFSMAGCAGVSRLGAAMESLKEQGWRLCSGLTVSPGGCTLWSSWSIVPRRSSRLPGVKRGAELSSFQLQWRAGCSFLPPGCAPACDVTTRTSTAGVGNAPGSGSRTRALVGVTSASLTVGAWSGGRWNWGEPKSSKPSTESTIVTCRIVPMLILTCPSIASDVICGGRNSLTPPHRSCRLHHHMFGARAVVI